MPLITGLSYSMRSNCFNLVTLDVINSNVPIVYILFWDLLALGPLSSLYFYFFHWHKCEFIAWTRWLRQLKKFHRLFLFHQMWFQVSSSVTHPTDRRWESLLASIAHWVVVGGTVKNTHRGFMCSLQLSHLERPSQQKNFQNFSWDKDLGPVNWIWISVTVTSYGEILLQLL